jgi:4-hydroxybenzoate polyprenyltransferase
MRKIIVLITDLIFLTRPIIVVPVWGFCAFGVYAAGGKNFLIHLEPAQYLLILLYSLSPAAVYVINQMADYEVDRANAGFPLLVRGNIPMRAAGICAAACALLSISIPLIMGYPTIALLSLAALAAGCVYSCKPFSLSGRPFCDFLTNAFEALLAFAAGWCVVGGGLADPALYVFALPYFLLMCAGAISSTLPDIPGDRAHGKVTTAVRFGPKAAHRGALAALAAVIPAALLLSGDYLALTCAALIIPIYVPYLVNASGKNMELTYKAGGAVTMIAAAIVLPLLFPAGVIVYLLTWLYFRKRHGVAYPSLTPDAAK